MTCDVAFGMNLMATAVQRVLTDICAGVKPRWQFGITITLLTGHCPPLSSKFVLADFGERITDWIHDEQSISAPVSGIRSQILVSHETEGLPIESKTFMKGTG